MGFMGERIKIIHDGTTEFDSRVRSGLVTAAGIAANIIVAVNVQPEEVALGSIALISATTAIEAWHQMKNMEIRDDLTHSERG